jgi:hypothetical protein
MSEGTNSSASLSYTHTDAIAIPPPGVETRLAIRRSDWARLKRHVDRCNKADIPGLAGWCLFCLGVSVTSVFTILQLRYAQGLEPWVMPTSVCVAACSLVLGIILHRLNRRLGAQRSDQVEELSTDMAEIEAAFPKED